MPDNDQRRGVEACGADHSGAVRGRGIRIGRTAVTGWALASVLVVAGFGTAMGATPVAVAQPVAVADTTDTDTTDTAGGSTEAVGLDPLALLPTADPVSPSAVLPVLPDLPTIGPAPSPTATETAAPQPGAGVVAPGVQLRRAEFTTDAPDARAAAAIRTALAQIGLPYVWGGNGPTNGDAGFDCSGLTTFSYASAGVSLPRTAHTQYNTGPHVPDGAPLQPGDLVFYGTTARVHHVGMYLGAGRMVNAPTFGKPVQVAFYRYSGDDYLGATRPAAAPGSLTSGILPFVDPATLPAVPRSAPEQVFTAPTAPMVALPQPGDPTLPPEQVSAAQSLQEANAVSVARSAAVAGASASTSAPVTTEPAAVGTETTGTATGTPTGVVTSTAPSTAVAGATTSTTVPVTSTPTTVTDPATVPQVVAGSSTATSTLTSTTTPAPVTTKAATPSTKKAAVVPKTTTPTTTAPTTTAAPKTATATKTTTSTTPADDTSTAKAVKTTAEDDATTTEKSTEKTTTEKSTEKTTTEKSTEKTTEKSTESDSTSSDSSDSSDSSNDES